MGAELDQKEILCAFCLNPNASNQKPIQGKITPDGKQAVAYLCDDHKDQEPKFAHQISNGKVTMVSTEDLSSSGTEAGEGLGVQAQEQQQQTTEVTAKKIAADVK